VVDYIPIGVSVFLVVIVGPVGFFVRRVVSGYDAQIAELRTAHNHQSRQITAIEQTLAILNDRHEIYKRSFLSEHES
jgi:uncharacterized membrane protein